MSIQSAPRRPVRRLHIASSLLLAATTVLASATVLAATPMAAATPASAGPSMNIHDTTAVHHRKVMVDGVEVFYREAGPRDAPVLLLLHGFPTSSQMFRDLIPRLSDRYRVIAPDYPGFGQSAAPSPDRFEYNFEHLAEVMDGFTRTLGLEHYALYLMDYGAPVGFRMATKHPDRITALVVQSGNAYKEGIGEFWDPIKAYWKDDSAENREHIRKAALTPEGTQWQYLHGVPDPTLVSPDAYMLDQAYLDRPGNHDIQLTLIHDYQSNMPLYPQWQAWMREHRPPTLVVWGRNDQVFLAAGAEAYKRDNPDAEVHMLDAGHFALETHGAQIAALMRDFLARH